MDRISRGGGRGRQEGATALEFALVLPVFFLLFYGMLTYGLIFLMRLGLQHAAEDGARAALRYPGTVCEAGMPCDAEDRRRFQFNQRLLAGYNRAMSQASWMDNRGDLQPLQVRARICPVGLPCLDDDADTVSCAEPDCETGTPPACSATTSCQIVVTVTYDYATAPFIPRVLGFGLVTPAALSGQARVLLDGRALAS